AGHRHEPHGQNCVSLNLTGFLSHDVKLLVFKWTDGDDQSPTLLQLLDQRLRDLLGGTGDNDGVEWRAIGPALIAIARLDHDIGIAESCQSSIRLMGERFNDLDGANLVNQP